MVQLQSSQEALSLIFFSYSKLATRECFILLFQGYEKQIQIKPMDGK